MYSPISSVPWPAVTGFLPDLAQGLKDPSCVFSDKAKLWIQVAMDAGRSRARMANLVHQVQIHDFFTRRARQFSMTSRDILDLRRADTETSPDVEHPLWQRINAASLEADQREVDIVEVSEDSLHNSGIQALAWHQQVMQQQLGTDFELEWGARLFVFPSFNLQGLIQTAELALRGRALRPAFVVSKPDSGLTDELDLYGLAWLHYEGFHPLELSLGNSFVDGGVISPLEQTLGSQFRMKNLGQSVPRNFQILASAIYMAACDIPLPEAGELDANIIDLHADMARAVLRKLVLLDIWENPNAMGNAVVELVPQFEKF